ncbi:hypothetical protein KOW79_007678 [Hemibagrus wyckioides]|uniref:Chemokine interleukin-8-like domain-containing protein n=1 Tax=Hemibagrus wyckioides TaxID=337641 RepID=A0A9D3NWI1_9TELE|nr:hypothetical protein KOW79_007678 [Hemibagrus wyckioides]
MSRVFLVLGFVLIMALYSDAMPRVMDDFLEPCCFKFRSISSEDMWKARNEGRIKKTGSHCSHQGFILTTREHSKLCVREITSY